LGLSRKLAMFDKLGGARAREVAQAFWQAPCEATWRPYQKLCSPLYNTRPAADPQAHARIVFNEEILYASARGEQQTMQLLPGLAQVCCPVLVMAGEQDPVTPLADAQDIAAAIPTPWGRLVTFANAGHGAWRDEPDAAMAVLRDFVQGATTA
jgi:pimeloyl-ACP methyl ester carboxylesterase